MMYMGGKSRHARRIAAAIMARVPAAERQVYVEPFVGGGAVLEALAPHFPVSYGSDLHQDIVLLWQAVVGTEWDPPATVSKDEYDSLRHAPPSAERAFAGIAASYGARWFEGYARHGRVTGNADSYVQQSRRSLLAARRVLRKLDLHLECCDYAAQTHLMRPGVVAYCDPPYEGTTRYQSGRFDSEKFWQVMHDWSSRGARVFVSEYDAPDDATLIWERGTYASFSNNRRTRSRAVERLYEM